MASASDNNVRPARRGNPAWDSANPALAVQSVYQHVDDHAAGVVDWYPNARRSKRIFARASRQQRADSGRTRRAAPDIRPDASRGTGGRGLVPGVPAPAGPAAGLLGMGDASPSTYSGIHAALGSLAPGVHIVSVSGIVDGKARSARRAVTVTAGKTTEVSFTL